MHDGIQYDLIQGDGTSQMSDNVVWSISPGGGTVGEVCRLRLRLVIPMGDHHHCHVLKL